MKHTEGHAEIMAVARGGVQQYKLRLFFLLGHAIWSQPIDFREGGFKK
jgi:hypothetical protein